MVWEQLSINRPHLVYIILGGFTSIFMLVSLFIKEKLYIGEATVATLCGVIFGPHAANLINPFTWGNTDQITLEFSRIVLVVQCFAVGVELPKAYMERHWRSVVFLLVPVMTCGWLMTSLFIWWLIVPLSWLESLAVAACVTATDPVLASSVVGKGKFAKRVPKHLRDVLSAESGCNDGMAFPFIYLGLYLIRFNLNAREVTYHWICYTILYECIFGAVYGVLIGYFGRHAIKLAERKGLIDRESFLVFYFVLALFCAGSGSMLGMDDLLIGFAAGVGFSNDGWFTERTEESSVSNVIDLLLNLTYFVYFGTIIPWDQYNSPSHGLEPWRLVVIAILVILFRRIPAMLALKPFIPDIKTWREALFAGHFGPISVGAIFASILARAELETGGATPLAILPGPGDAEYTLIWTIWPIVTFLVIASIVVHGSSIAVFTLGKRINTLTITLSYTQDNEKSSAWMNRLPRMSKSFSKASDDWSLDKEVPPGQLPPIGIRGFALRRQKEDENDSRPGSRSSSLGPFRRRRRKDYGGPIDPSAIAPVKRSQSSLVKEESGSDTLNEQSGEVSPASDPKPEGGSNQGPQPESHHHSQGEGRRKERRELSRLASESDAEIECYEEGHELVIEDEEGNVLDTIDVRGKSDEEKARIMEKVRKKLAADHSGQYTKHKHQPHEKDEGEDIKRRGEQDVESAQKAFRGGFRNWAGFSKRKEKEDSGEGSSRQEKKKKHSERKRGPAHAYQFGNTIIVEDEDGEVIKKYTIPASEEQQARNEQVKQGLQRMSTWVGFSKPQEGPEGKDDTASKSEDQGAAAVGTDSLQSDHQQTHTGTLTKGKNKNDDDAAALSDDDGLRLTISNAQSYGLTGLQKRKQSQINPDDEIATGAGRRLSTKDFIKQIQTLDPKSKIKEVEKSDAPEGIKREIKRQARQEDQQDEPPRPSVRRNETMPAGNDPSPLAESRISSHRPILSFRSQSERPDTMVRPSTHRQNTDESVESIEEAEIPTHDLRASIARRGQGSTAADLRRKRLSTMKEVPEGVERQLEEPSDGEAEDYFGYDSSRNRKPSISSAVRGDGNEDDYDERETSAEKRRREAALGLRRPDESDSDDDERPRQPRGAAVPEPGDERAATLRGRQEAPRRRIQWGGESGRETENEDNDNGDISEHTARREESTSFAKKFKVFLNKNV